VAQHRHQRHEARAAGEQEQRAAVIDRPGERPADRAAQLQLISGAHLAGQVRRHLAVVDPLDRERHDVALRLRRDRERALRLVAVLRGEAHVDVLAGAVAAPVGHLEHERAGGRRLVDRLAYAGEPPEQRRRRRQSPW
jgi:hypothetical protein